MQGFASKTKQTQANTCLRCPKPAFASRCGVLLAKQVKASKTHQKQTKTSTNKQEQATPSKAKQNHAKPRTIPFPTLIIGTRTSLRSHPCVPGPQVGPWAPGPQGPRAPGPQGPRAPGSLAPGSQGPWALGPDVNAEEAPLHVYIHTLHLLPKPYVSPSR